MLNQRLLKGSQTNIISTHRQNKLSQCLDSDSQPISLKKSQTIALVCLLRVDQLEGPDMSSNTHLLPFPFPTQRDFVQNEEGTGRECSQEQSVLRQATTSPGKFWNKNRVFGLKLLTKSISVWSTAHQNPAKTLPSYWQGFIARHWAAYFSLVRKYKRTSLWEYLCTEKIQSHTLNLNYIPARKISCNKNEANDTWK